MNDYSYYCALWTICYSLNTWNFGAGVLRTKTIKSVVFHNRPLFLCAELTSFCVLYEKGDETLFIIGEIHVPFKLQTIRCRQINFRVNWLSASCDVFSLQLQTSGVSGEHEPQ